MKVKQITVEFLSQCTKPTAVTMLHCTSNNIYKQHLYLYTLHIHDRRIVSSMSPCLTVRFAFYRRHDQYITSKKYSQF